MNNMSNRVEFDKVLEKIAFYASFSLSRERILHQEPSFSGLIVRRDLARMKDALQCVITNGSLSFGGISDVSQALTFAQKGGVLSVHEIVDVGRFMQGIQRLKRQYNDLEGDYPALEDLFDSLQFHEDLLKHVEHAYSEQGEVLDRASGLLGDIRRSIRQLEGSIDVQSQAFLNKHKDMLSEAVISYQHGRQTFLLKPSEKNKMEGTIYGTSASGQSVYFEPAFLARMQNELAGLKSQEGDEIERICRDTSHLIGVDALQLNANLETATLIDVLMAKANWGKHHDAVVASLTTDSLRLVQARHPLIDAKDVVANTYQLVAPHKMILISGPNTGGKSVSLKTMGLAVLLTHAGCPVLAEKAEVMLVDKVFVDIGDQQSIEKSLSSFSAHMQTMTRVSMEATSRSLVLLDELGSQTDPLEGESLSMALLDHFREVGCWVIATTHFSRLKQYGTQHNDILIASVAFDLKNLQPTYHYREHITGESNAFAIAKRLGLNPAIIDAAFKYKQESQYEADHMLELLEAKILEQDTLNQKSAAALAEIEALKLAQQDEEVKLKKRLEAERMAMLEANDAKLAAMLETAERKLEALNQTNRPDLRQKAVKEIQALQKETVDETIGVGDRVQLKATHQVGVVEMLERKNAQVLIGGLKVRVPVNKLTKIAGPVKQTKTKAPRSHTVNARSRFQTECNLIGMRVADAMPILDKFMDDALVHKVYQFRVIHGHGTGQLRTAVHQRLRKHKYVAGFELAGMGEGGMGATVVKLKQV